jgi:hypothetical protein
MIEESETVDPDPAQAGIEGDLLAQRRARRAELSDPALIRRAEVAEATVRTLETHLSSLQQRLQETGEEQRRMSEQLSEREREVRRVKQREYAEQQLRVEVEERCELLTSEKRAEIEELHRRLSVSERHAHELADQLEGVRFELTEAQQLAAAERMVARQEDEELAEREADLQQRELQLEQATAEIDRHLNAARDFERRASALRQQAQEREDILTIRLAELERRATEVQQEVETQQIARERSELTLGRVQESNSVLKLIVRELEQAARQLRGAIEQERATLQQEFDRKREELTREHAAEIERERERLSAQQAAQIADAQQQIATHIAELESQRKELSREQVEQFEQAQRQSATHIAELESQREQLSREHAAQIEQARQLRTQLERQREELSSEHAEKLEQMRSRVRELEGERERTAADLRRRGEIDPDTLDPAEPIISAELDSADVARRREALTEAVKRLRAKVATDEELGEPAPADAPGSAEPDPATAVVPDVAQPTAAPVPQTPSVAAPEPAEKLEPGNGAEPAENLDFVPRVLVPPKQPPTWFTTAIRRLVERGEEEHALDVLSEVLALRHLVVNDRMTYSIEIEEVGEYLVELDGERSSAKKVTAPSLEDAVDVKLKGNLLAVSELTTGRTARKISGLKTKGSRRRVRKLLRASATPLVLGDVARAGKAIWPGVLLLAIAAAIDPEWTKGHKFAVAFQATGESRMTVCLRVDDGKPIQVLRMDDGKPSRVPRPDHGEVLAKVSLSDLALTCLLARAPMPARETELIEGDSSALEKLMRWSDRAQGLEVSA